MAPTVIHISDPRYAIGPYDVRVARGEAVVHIDRDNFVEIVFFDGKGEVDRIEVSPGLINCGCQ
jgi:hypothetical protein